MRIQRHDAIETSKIPIVVIIGASFSGISALTHLYPHVRVIVIDSKDYFEYYPGILVSMTGKRLDQMIQPLKSFVEPYGRFIQGYFTSIEPKSKLVHIQTLTGEISSLKYDALLLCCGVPYSLPIKSSTQSMEKRKEELLSFSSKVQGYKRIAIIGGGLIGVELAAELYQHVPSTQLLIFTSEDRLLPTLPVSAGNVAQKWLSKCGVEIIFRAKIDSILHDSPEMFYQLKTSSGDSYSVDYVINCTGITSLVSDQYRTPPAEKIVDVSKMETTLRTHRGTIVTNSHFQVHSCCQYFSSL